MNLVSTIVVYDSCLSCVGEQVGAAVGGGCVGGFLCSVVGARAGLRIPAGPTVLGGFRENRGGSLTRVWHNHWIFVS